MLHQIETHGDQGHAQHQVHGTQYEAELDAFYRIRLVPVLGDVFARHEVTEPDGAQRYETEVGRVEEFPLLPFGEQHGASGYEPLTKTHKKKKSSTPIDTKTTGHVVY